VSEVVTNAVIHARLHPADTIDFRAEIRQEQARVRVCNPARGPFRPVSASQDREGGWGLLLVDEFADRWGIDHGARTCVWFDLAVAL
jgi:anti-sigma regulatory factor (Ser/Thr protein kinase)